MPFADNRQGSTPPGQGFIKKSIITNLGRSCCPIADMNADYVM